MWELGPVSKPAFAWCPGSPGPGAKAAAGPVPVGMLGGKEEVEEAEPLYRAVQPVTEGLTHTKAHRCELCESPSR